MDNVFCILMDLNYGNYSTLRFNRKVVGFFTIAEAKSFRDKILLEYFEDSKLSDRQELLEAMIVLAEEPKNIVMFQSDAANIILSITERA